MGRFYYMLPAATTAEPARLAEFGLIPDRIGGSVASRGCTVGLSADGLPTVGGADQRPCTLFGAPKAPLFGHGRQTWHRIECEGPEVWWIGFETDDPPGPDDLIRPGAVLGYRVRLGDGRWWNVPVARQFPEGTALPAVLRMGGGGRLVRDLPPEYVSLFERCAPWATAYYEHPDEPLTLAMVDAWRLALDGLAVNYRVGMAEVNALGLFTEATVEAVISCLLDMQTCDEATAARIAQARADEGAPEDENPTPPAA